MCGAACNDVWVVGLRSPQVFSHAITEDAISVTIFLRTKIAMRRVDRLDLAKFLAKTEILRVIGGETERCFATHDGDVGVGVVCLDVP
jgi:hypothetical protein